MKGLPLTKSVLLALTLLLPPTHGRAQWRRPQQQNHHHHQQQQQQQDLAFQYPYGWSSYSRQGVTPYGHYTSSYKPTNALLQQLLEPLPARLDPLNTNSLEDTVISNDLALTPEDLAPYTTHNMKTLQSFELDRTRQLASSYQTYNEEVCATVRGWDVLKESVDLDGNLVDIIHLDGQSQTFYRYECENKCDKCKGVKVNSRCKQRFTYIKLYHYLKSDPPGARTPRWGFVEVPSHCACELVPPNTHDECDLP